jgi:hypothetical protein
MKQKFIEEFWELDKIQSGSPPEIMRKRGVDFERLINDVLEDETILLKRSYHTSDNQSEQIDGAIEIYNRIFLVEVKWVSSNMAASELYGFIGKIENKFSGTLGVFISRNELTKNFIDALNKGRRQSVIVIHGKDIELLFSRKTPIIKEYLTYCFKLLSYDNRTHLSLEDY